MKKRTGHASVVRVLPLAGVLLLAGATAFAQEAEPTDMAKFFGYLGLIELPKDPIEYRERAPLVVPPSPSLVPPQQTNINQINPDFPIDHDERVRQARRVDPKEQARQDDIFYNNRKLSPEEMSRKRAKDRNAGTATGADDTFHDVNKSRMSPTQLGFGGWGGNKDEPVVFAGEPDRSSLVEPPPGYRTPSPNAPYGVVSKKQERYVPKSYMDKTVDSDSYGRR